MRFKTYLRTRLKEIVPDEVPLPSGFHILGHVVLLKLESDAMSYAEEIGDAILQYSKRIRTVAIKTGPTINQIRTPSYKVIAGDPDTIVTHIENGVIYHLDPLRITFSAGNRGERAYIASIAQPYETVIDMFACVGQFTLPIAKVGGCRVISLEINPKAYEFLIENIELNGLSDRVNAILGDCRDTIPMATANRIVMGFLHDTISFLPYAIDGLKLEGGTIHMHALVYMGETAELCNTINTLCKKRGYLAQITPRKVKSYSPKMNHYCFDISLVREE